LIGRGDLVVRFADQLQRQGLLTVVGPGGIGKVRRGGRRPAADRRLQGRPLAGGPGTSRRSGSHAECRGEVLVKIIASGVCHTDPHAAAGDWLAKPVPPFIPGHEGAGIVAALGPGVTTLKEGHRVVIAWLHDACGGCEYCVTGWETLCPGQRNSGYSVNGSFAKYAIGAAPYLGRLPHTSAAPSIARLIQKLFRRDQIGGFETLGKAVVDGLKAGDGIGGSTLTA
jgi:Alcohol dehydrogenase GroES-like domain